MQLGSGTGSWTRQAAIIGGLLCFAAVARAQSFSISGSPGAMRINAAIAGQLPTDDQELSTTYTVKAQNKKSPLKIMARLNVAMPPGVTLTIEMQAPSGAVGNGPVTLDATDREIVGSIDNNKAQTRSITYTLSATPAAGVVAPQSRTVIFTLTDWP
jgi:hypothetical protein